MRLITAFFAGLLVLGAATEAAAQMPTPVLQFAGTEQYQAGGKQWVRYKLSVVNRASYDLFTPAPYLPPCGLNPNSSRSWVDVRNGQSPYVRLYGFCALGSPDDLGDLWFAVEKGRRPPRSAFITITDRRAKRKVTSNRVVIW